LLLDVPNNQRRLSASTCHVLSRSSSLVQADCSATKTQVKDALTSITTAVLSTWLHTGTLHKRKGLAVNQLF